MDLGISGRVAIVTASSKGLGRASAEALAAEGVDVVLCARGAEALEATAASIRAGGGGRAIAVEADVTHPDVPAQLVRAALDEFGRLDIVVGNASGPPPMRALDVDATGVHAAVEANLLTSVRLAQAALPHLRSQQWGRLCFIASVSVRQPLGDLALSNIARTGLWAWAKTAAQDLAGEGITVNLACPGLHATDRVAEVGHSGRMGDPADFGKVVAFLCSEPARYVSGIAMGVDGAAVNGLL
jgi:3-oxoacyl-[acyl-carrier protein] reductase